MTTTPTIAECNAMTDRFKRCGVYAFELEQSVPLSESAQVMLVFLRRHEALNAIPVSLSDWGNALAELVAKGFVEDREDEEVVLKRERKITMADVIFGKVA